MRRTAEDLDEELLAAIQRLGRLMASRQVSKRIRHAADVQLGQQAVQIVRALHRGGQLSIARIAEAAAMDIAAVSRQLGALESDGVVRRDTTVADGRVALVSLTPAGVRVAERVRAVGLGHLRDALAAWPAADRRDLARLLGRLVDDFVATDVPSLR